MAPQRATASTLYVAYRLNDPREIMPPHRHSPNAIRLGLTGTMNFTGVEGENITFGPGDMVLTPHDTWHNHGNKSEEPAINLSVLDLPVFAYTWFAVWLVLFMGHLIWARLRQRWLSPRR